jgi:hypothetical protein
MRRWIDGITRLDEHAILKAPQDAAPAERNTLALVAENKQSVDGRHKAGHDDSWVGGGLASDQADQQSMRRSLVASPYRSPQIVMAGLVPAIHGFLS